MKIVIGRATEAHAAALAALRNAVSEDLTRRYGPGHWSSGTHEAAVLRAIAGSHVLVARRGRRIVGTLRLATKKPWAIDRSYFVPVPRPLYLLDMAVEPASQRSGIGRRLLEEARAVAVTWPAQAIWLDAYDAPAGAGGFYAACGYREVGRAVYRRVPLLYFELLL